MRAPVRLPVDRAFADARAQVRQADRARSPTRARARAGEARPAGGLCARPRRADRRSRPSTTRALSDLYDALRARAARARPRRLKRRRSRTEPHPIRVAIVGRPNAGKSTLINRLIGEERLLTGPEAGTTRDAIAVDLDWQGRKFRLYDTAGLRRRSRVDEKLEKLSVADALNAVRFAEVVVVLLDVGKCLRGTGPAHRRSGRAGRPRHRDRGQQMGSEGKDGGRHRQVARAGRREAHASSRACRWWRSRA